MNSPSNNSGTNTDTDAHGDSTRNGAAGVNSPAQELQPKQPKPEKHAAEKPEPKKADPEQTGSAQQTQYPTKSADTDKPEEHGGPKGLEPTRYGDWERNGRCTDF